jgi:hypothetical protein
MMTFMPVRRRMTMFAGLTMRGCSRSYRPAAQCAVIGALPPPRRVTSQCARSQGRSGRTTRRRRPRNPRSGRCCRAVTRVQ